MTVDSELDGHTEFIYNYTTGCLKNVQSGCKKPINPPLLRHGMDQWSF